MQPVLKWVGGKRQLIDSIYKLMPRTYNHYYEPFIGGGALFFSLKPSIAYINDINQDLLCIYLTLANKSYFDELIKLLNEHEKNHSEDYYYVIRSLDRNDSYKDMKIYEKAARVIYLNKAGYNGLYRVNSKGYYNVPFGKKDKVKIYSLDNLLEIHNHFNNNQITITNLDFEETVKNVKAEDFVYFDPPYDPWEKKASFTAYAKNDFSKEDQLRLFHTFKKLSEKRAKVMLSNHNTIFIRELYKDYHIHVVQAKRLVNSKSDGRGNVEEVIITNYETNIL